MEASLSTPTLTDWLLLFLFLTDNSFIYKGANAATVTDGTDSIYTIYSGAGFRGAIDVGDIILPKGSSLAVEITTQSSNSSMAVAVAAEVYLRPTTDI